MKRKTTKNSRKSRSRPVRAGTKMVTLVVGGLVIATLALGGGSLALQGQAADFPPVEGLASIDAGLEIAGGYDNLVVLTQGDGKIDLMYVGAPECGHCQSFMANGFDDMVDKAKDLGLDFAYYPAAMSAVGVTIATLEACTLADGATKVRAAYALNEPVTRGAIAGQELQGSGADEVEVSEFFTTLLETSQKAFGESAVFDAACYEREAPGMISRLNEVHRTFGLSATPTFYFMDADGVLREQIGDSAIDEMMRQISPDR